MAGGFPRNVLPVHARPRLCDLSQRVNTRQRKQVIMRRLGTVSTVGFVASLAGFILPWVSILRDWPFALVGYNIALGKYNIQPTENYALMAAVIGVAGAGLPNVLPRRKTWTRTFLALSGLVVLLLLRFHGQVSEMEWRLGYYVTLAAFAAVAALNLAAIMGLLGRPGRRRSRSSRHLPVIGASLPGVVATIAVIELASPGTVGPLFSNIGEQVGTQQEETRPELTEEPQPVEVQPKRASVPVSRPSATPTETALPTSTARPVSRVVPAVAPTRTPTPRPSPTPTPTQTSSPTATPLPIQIPGRSYLYEDVLVPEHMAYTWWHWSRNRVGFREIITDVTIHRDVDYFPEHMGIYLMLGQGEISGIHYYYGMQVDGGGGHPIEERVIFSRWDTRDLANARIPAGGWTQSSGHEGDFIGVRRRYAWTSGEYRLRIAPDGKGEDGEWFGLWVQDMSSPAVADRMRIDVCRH